MDNRVIGSSHIDRIAMRKGSDRFSVAAFDERVIGLSLTPIEGHLDWLDRLIGGFVAGFHAHGVKTARVSTSGGTFQNIFEKNRTNTGRDARHGLIVNYVPRLAGIGKRPGALPD